MIGNFIGDGNIYPTVGISFGLSSIQEIVKESFLEEDASTDIYIIPMNTDIECLKVANILRNNGYKVEVEMMRNKLKKGLDYANRQGIKYVIIIGEDELKDNTVVVKDMFNNNDIKISLDKINELELRQIQDESIFSFEFVILKELK